MSSPLRSVIALALATGALACTPKRLDEAGANVRVISYAPVGCERLGEVEGDQGGAVVGDFTSRKDLDAGARNEARNRAAKLGANVVQLVKRSGVGSQASFAGSRETAAVQYHGIAWRCPR